MEEEEEGTPEERAFRESLAKAADSNGGDLQAALASDPELQKQAQKLWPDIRLEEMSSGLREISSGIEALHAAQEQMSKDIGELKECYKKLDAKVEHIQHDVADIKDTIVKQHGTLKDKLLPCEFDDDIEQSQERYCPGTRLWIIEAASKWVFGGGGGDPKQQQAHGIMRKTSVELRLDAFKTAHPSWKERNPELAAAEARAPKKKKGKSTLHGHHAHHRHKKKKHHHHHHKVAPDDEQHEEGTGNAAEAETGVRRFSAAFVDSVLPTAGGDDDERSDD